MFFRQKKTGKYTYLQLVENRWEDGRSKQRVLATLGRLDELQQGGELERLLTSGARFAEAAIVLSAYESGDAETISTRHIGPGLIFDRLWQESGCQEVIRTLLSSRSFEFPVERAIFATVLHRLIEPGSDRQAARWLRDTWIEGAEELQLHHLYRAMAWLGEELPDDQQHAKTPFSPRCVKDLVEEYMFTLSRDLFSGLGIVFFDTTSLYFEGAGGQSMGARGHSKDHRPDLKQIVVGLVIDRDGKPICCELWPGNTADVRTLIPIVDRLQQRFSIEHICVVADRGMISNETIAQLEERGMSYILGARMRAQTEVRDEVLSRAGRYQVVHEKGSRSSDPSPLKVKEVVVDERRYIVCLNEDQARKEAADRKAIIESLQLKLKRGSKALVGNKGYRKYLKPLGKAFSVDMAKVESEARFDGKWVLRTNSTLPAAEVALEYKQLWMVEQLFRTTKSILDTRPIFHQLDETIRGHVFCSFLALVLQRELEDRLARRDPDAHYEWADIVRDLSALEEVTIRKDGKQYVLRGTAKGVCGRVFQAAGVAIPRTITPTAQEMVTG